MNDNPALKFNLQIPLKRIQQILIGVLLINLIFLFGTYLQHKQSFMVHNSAVQIFLFEFNLSKENHLAAWYSSMLLFTAGITAALCFWADMQRAVDIKSRILNVGWVVIACIFIMLSFDEMGSFHEMIGETALLKMAGGGTGAGWYAFYALIGLVAVFMVLFFFLKFRKNWISFALAVVAVLLFVSNPFQEKLEMYSWRNSIDPDNWRRPVSLLLIEEGSEIFATFCFLFSFINYAVGASSVVIAGKGKMLQLQAYVTKYFMYYLVGFIFLLGSIMLVIHFNAWNFKGDDNGIPDNWPPSATSFFASLVCLYLYHQFSNLPSSRVYLLLGSVSLLISLYYGSNIYYYRLLSHPYYFLPYVMAAIVAIAVLYSIPKMAGIYSKFCMAAWTILLTATMLANGFPTAFLGYIASALLIIGLFLNYQARYKQASVLAEPPGIGLRANEPSLL